MPEHLCGAKFLPNITRHTPLRYANLIFDMSNVYCVPGCVGRLCKMHRPQWLRRKEKASSTKAVSNRLSGSSLEKIASSNPAADSPNRNVGTGDLWDRAYTELRKSHSELVDQFEKTLLSEGLGDLEATSREEQLSKIIDTKLALMNQNEWVINFAGKSVEVRKQVERLVKVVGITKDSLNVVANIDPIHIGLPVAAICLLMPVSPRSLTFSRLLS